MEGANTPTWGSISHSNRRSQSRTPPLSAVAALPLSGLRPTNNASVDTHDRNNADVHVNHKERNKPKGVESPTTTSDASSPASPKVEYGSLETPPTPICTDHAAAAAALTSSSSSADADVDPSSIRGRKKDRKSRKSNSNTMTPPEDTRQAESEPLCEGDTKVIYDILPEPRAQDIFERVRAEVSWQRMSHQGGEVPRLVAVQGAVEADGSKPVYRHPSDESPPLRPFTPAVDEIRRAAEARLGHPLNHALVQLYRCGGDFISEHSDKTLDIARGSFIANVSLGAERTMTLRTKRRPRDAGDDNAPANRKRQVQRARLPHNSLFQMGLATNARWLHAIRPDKRLASEKTDAELAYSGSRISLTFRHIGTFLDGPEARIWGQGATSKTRASARPVVNGQTEHAVAMLRAFGRENQSEAFDWEAQYGGGFDVLHISLAPRLFLSEGDDVVNARLRVMLAELGVAYARGSVSGGSGNAADTTDVLVKFVDNDDAKTAVTGQRDVMVYLQETYGRAISDNERVRGRFREGLGLLDLWRAVTPSSPPSSLTEKEEEKRELKDEVMAKVIALLAPWELYAAEDAFIAGPTPGLADFAFWPVLRDILSSSLFPASTSSPPKKKGGKKRGDTKETQERGDGEGTERLPNLRAYHARMLARDAIARALR